MKKILIHISLIVTFVVIYLLESIFELKPEGDLNTLDTLRDDLILFFKRDNLLYKRIKKDIEDIKNVKKF